MADDVERIRIEIEATAAQLRAELDTAIKKLGGLSAAVKDVPKQVRVDIAMETAAADSKLGKLREQIRATKREIGDTPRMDVDTGLATLKLAALEREAARVKREIGDEQAGIGGGGGRF